MQVVRDADIECQRLEFLADYEAVQRAMHTASSRRQSVDLLMASVGLGIEEKDDAALQTQRDIERDLWRVAVISR